jgi:hypothetical protein
MMMDPQKLDSLDITKAAERLMEATASMAVWWTMVEAEKELVDGDVHPDDTVVLSYMGCGASTQVTAKELRQLRDARNDLYTVAENIKALMSGLTMNVEGILSTNKNQDAL